MLFHYKNSIVSTNCIIMKLGISKFLLPIYYFYKKCWKQMENKTLIRNGLSKMQKSSLEKMVNNIKY